MRYVKIVVCTATLVPSLAFAGSVQSTQPAPVQRAIIQAPAPVITRQAPVTQPQAIQSNRPGYTFLQTPNGNVQVFQNGRLISTGTAGYAQQFGYRGPVPSPWATTPAPRAAVPTFSPAFQPVTGPTTPATMSTVGTIPPPSSGRLQFTPVTKTPVTNQNTALSVTQSGNPSLRGANVRTNSNPGVAGPTNLFPSTQLNPNVQVTAWAVSSSARNALIPLAASNHINTTNAMTRNGYIYPTSLRNASTNQQVQCTELVTALSNVGPAGNWTNAGSATISPYSNGNHPTIPAGTPIATFEPNNQYPAQTGVMGTSRLDGKTFLGDQSHAAIFMSYITDKSGNPIGMNILSQSATQKASVEARYFITNTPIDATRNTMGYAYSEIEN